MDPDVALGLTGAFLLALGVLVSRIPVRCPHAGPCLECELEAEKERLAQEQLYAQMDHRWHVDPAAGCDRCRRSFDRPGRGRGLGRR